ncbi:MAG: hypothetical protein HYS06_01340 [Methylocystis sp.]|nr:hypothetical protein [Methylocystis sp.]
MRLLFALICITWPVVLTKSVTAQRTYTFEEACRMAGQTTGPCAPKSQQPQSPLCVEIGGNAFHAEKSPALGNCINTTLSPSADAEIFVELIGLPNIPKVNELQLTIRRASGFGNAVALFHEGARLIVYDPVWAKSVTAESYLVLAHEAGHHFCGHTIQGFRSSRKEAELEADRFSGASIRRFEAYHGRAFLDAALAAAERLYSEQGLRSHPPRSARIDAIMRGYNDGSPCGGLAPAIRGYSPNPR